MRVINDHANNIYYSAKATRIYYLYIQNAQTILWQISELKEIQQNPAAIKRKTFYF